MKTTLRVCPKPLALVSLRLRSGAWEDLGFRRPESWTKMILLALAAAAVRILAGDYLIQHLAMRFWPAPISPGGAESITGSVKMALVALGLIWTFAAFGEEIVYRSYLVTRVADLGGRSRISYWAGIEVVAALFGIGHYYKGSSGVINSGFAGFVLGAAYLLGNGICGSRSPDFAVTSIHPLVELLPSFEECPRRIYMSATIADDSSIVRTFGADKAAALKPISPQSLAGVGERMILMPSLMPLDNTDAVTVTKEIAFDAVQHSGVVVLVPSELSASDWDDLGQVVLGEGVSDAVRALVDRTANGPFVFPNRYDGIDLIGDACRFLVLDGLPRGATTYDLFRAEVLQGNSSINVGLAQRIEQGLGRATRGAGDYCVVFLVGRDLVSWITRVECLELVTSSTKTQILLGHEISRAISSSDELKTTVMQCFHRDPTWTKYHAETLAEQRGTPAILKDAISAAEVERKYLQFCVARRFGDAAAVVSQLAGNDGIDRRYQGWLLQLAARAALYDESPALAEDYQRRAFLANNLLAPPKAAIPYEPVKEVGRQVENTLRGIAGFALRKGFLQAFDETTAYLTPTATSNQFEESMKKLGTFLGFKGQRPEREYRTGPDVLWLDDSKLGFVIECKSQKGPQNPLTKGEHGQLLTASEWFRAQYPSREAIRLIVHPSDLATPESAAGETYTLTLDKLGQLVAQLRHVLEELCASYSELRALEKPCAKLPEECRLTPSGIVGHFLTKFRALEAKPIRK